MDVGGGLEHLVVLLDGALVGLNPHNGDGQWQVPFKADFSIAVATPVCGADNLIFISSEYGGGAKVIDLKRNGLQTSASVLWSSPRLRLHHGNAIRIGDTIYFSSGGKGTQAILTAVDVRSGKVLWQQRSIEKATFVWADQKLITLDQDGKSDDRAAVARRVYDYREGAAADAAFVDTAGSRRNPAVHPRPPDDDGGRSRLTTTSSAPPSSSRGQRSYRPHTSCPACP